MRELINAVKELMDKIDATHPNGWLNTMPIKAAQLRKIQASATTADQHLEEQKKQIADLKAELDTKDDAIKGLTDMVTELETECKKLKEAVPDENSADVQDA